MPEDEKTVEDLMTFLAEQAEDFWQRCDAEYEDVDEARITTVALIELAVGIALDQQDIPKADFIGLFGAIYDRSRETSSEKRINSGGSSERN